MFKIDLLMNDDEKRGKLSTDEVPFLRGLQHRLRRIDGRSGSLSARDHYVGRTLPLEVVRDMTRSRGWMPHRLDMLRDPLVGEMPLGSDIALDARKYAWLISEWKTYLSWSCGLGAVSIYSERFAAQHIRSVESSSTF